MKKRERGRRHQIGDLIISKKGGHLYMLVESWDSKTWRFVHMDNETFNPDGWATSQNLSEGTYLLARAEKK